MWHWIQNALSKKRQQFFFDILILVTCIHFFCIICAFIYQSKRGIEQISLVAPDIRGSTLVFVPLHKKIEQPKTTSSVNSLQKPHHMMNYDEFLDRQKKAESAKKSGVAKTGVAKAAPEKKALSKSGAQKAPIQKVSVQKASAQKIAEPKKVESKKEASIQQAEKKAVSAQKVLLEKVSAPTSIKTESIKSKKVEVKKTAAPQVPAEKKTLESIEAPAQKNQEVSQEKSLEKQVAKVESEQVKEVVQEAVEPQKVVESSVAHVQEESNNAQENVLPFIDMNDVTFIGVQDLEHLQIQQLISGQLAKHWKRPVGMENKLCVIKIELHATGKIITATVEKSSGVPMYDMAAKAAAVKTTYPQEIWNKKLVIQF